MKIGAVLCICLSGLLCSPALATHGQAGTADAIDTALSQCLGSISDKAPAATPSADLPPGLSRGKAVHVDALPGIAGKAYAYEGTSPREMACGIAIYGPVSDAVKSEIVGLIDSHAPIWTRHAPDPYRLSGRPAEEIYWGDPKAPGMTGVLLLSRKPSAGAPTLEVDYHKALIF